MSAPGPTPGPWAVSKGCDQYVCADGLWIASTIGVRGEQGAANAHLIAAAPDLFEALCGLIQVEDAKYQIWSTDMSLDKRERMLASNDVHRVKSLLKARAALAKARGEA